MKEGDPNIDVFLNQIVQLLRESKYGIIKTVNSIMVQTYFELGKRIVEHEQKGNNYSNYGDYLLENLSKELSKEFGKGFSRRKLELIRKFYITYKITKTVFSQSIGWSHYLHLMRIENEDERKFYEIEIEKNTWSVRELERQINSSLYERLSLSKDKEAILKLSQEGQTVEKAEDLIKDPYILEFLDLYDFSNYSETEFEQALINKLEHFLLELGNGFTFVGRQQRFTFDEDIFRVDLVFFNRILKCFVLIDIKIGKLKHQDLGQMQMYVNYYDRYIKLDEENKTIGIILCKDKKDTLVEITLPENNNQIFASKYLTVLPSKETLIQLMEKSSF